MLHALETKETGYGIVIFSAVGAYHAPGQDVRRAVGQFNAMSEGLPMAGNRIEVRLYTDSAAAGSLNGEASYQTFFYVRENAQSNFQLEKRTLDILCGDQH